MNVWKFFEMAKKAAQLRDDQRAFQFGAIGLRDDGIIVAACNGCVVLDKNDRRGFFPKCHAEFRICRKLDKNSTVFVARIALIDGKYKNAKPCKTCQNAMRTRGVTKVYYTISDDEYGVMHIKK